MTAKINQCRDCRPKDQWIEIRLVDEMNQPFGSLNGKLKDATGSEYQVMLSGGYLLLTGLPAGPVELKIETSALLNEAKKHKPRLSPQTSPAKEYADKHKGYQNKKIRYQHVALGDLWTVKSDMPREHQAGATGTHYKLATGNSYLLETRCFEYKSVSIAVVGAQHDNRIANKMMFAGQAVRYFKQTVSKNKIMILFTVGYTKEQIDAIIESSLKVNFHIRQISTRDELIEYLNSFNTHVNPINELNLYSHGIPGSVEFGYGFNSASTMNIDIGNINFIKKSIFSSSGKINSYACRTGMGNLVDIPIVEDVAQFSPQIEKSLAQIMSNHFRVNVHAFIRRTTYEDTWGSREDRYKYKLCNKSIQKGSVDLFNVVAPSWSWCDVFDRTVNERDYFVKKIGVAYNINGALHPVKADIDPVTIDAEMEFHPK